MINVARIIVPLQRQRTIYTLLTETLREEAGLVIDHDIRSLQHDKGEVKTKMSQIECNTNRANVKKASRDSLLKEFKIAEKELIKITQDERKLDTTGDADKDKIRAKTTAWVQHHLDQKILPTPMEGTRKDQEDPVIYNNEIELLSQGIKDKLEILAKISNTISKLKKRKPRSEMKLIKCCRKVKRSMEHWPKDLSI